MQNQCMCMLIFFGFLFLKLYLHIAKRAWAAKQNSEVLVLVWADHSTSLGSMLICRIDGKANFNSFSTFYLIILYGRGPKYINIYT